MSQFGLSAETLATMRRILGGHPQIEKAVLYGSRAKGTYKPGSDIDLTLIGLALDYQILSAVAEAFAASSIPYTVDLSLFDALDNQSLREHIERVGLVFYERGASGTQ